MLPSSGFLRSAALLLCLGAGITEVHADDPSASASSSTSSATSTSAPSSTVASSSTSVSAPGPTASTSAGSLANAASASAASSSASPSSSSASAGASASASSGSGGHRRNRRGFEGGEVDTNTESAKAALVPDNGPTAATRAATSASDAADPVPPPPLKDTYVPATPEKATASPVAMGAPRPLRALHEAGAGEVVPGPALTLADCFRLAAVRSDTLKISAQDVLVAKTQWSQAAAALFPTVSLVNSESFQNQVRNGTASRLSLSGTAGRDYSSQTGVQASYTLFNGLQNYNAVGAATQTVEAKRQSLRYAYQTLYQDVASSYYQTLIDAGQVAILGDLVRDFESRVAELDRRVKLGRSRPADLLLAQADLASGRVNLEQEKALMAADLELLAFYIGVPSGKIFLKDETALPSAINLEAYLRNLNFRPDLLAQLATIRAAERTLSEAKGQLWPTITANFNWTPLNDPTSTQQWTATFQASLPIFDGGLIIGRINEQRELLRQSQFTWESLQRTGDQQLRSAFASFNGSVAQYLQNRQYAELSALNFNAQLDDYRHGVSANLDVLTALQSYHTARQQLHVADMTARLNFIKLHVAAGNAPTGAEAKVTATNAPPPDPAASTAAGTGPRP